MNCENILYSNFCVTQRSRERERDGEVEFELL